MFHPLRYLRVLLFSATTIASGSGSEPPAAPGSPTPPSIIADVPMRFTVHGQKIPVPVVEAQLEGSPVVLIVDTGSSHQAITTQYADAHGLTPATAGSGSGVGHAGESLAVQRLPKLSLALGRDRREIGDAIVTRGPDSLVKLGIAGFLSPQNLVPTCCVVLDFIHGRLQLIEGSCAGTVAWLQEQSPGLRRADVPQVTGPEPRKRYVPTTVAEYPDLVTEIDSGGSATEYAEALFPNAAATAPVSAAGQSVSGQRIPARSLAAQHVLIGNLALGPVPIRARSTLGGIQGRLGADILRGTIVILPADPQEPVIFLAPSASP